MAVVRRRRASRLARLLFYGGALALAVYLGRERLLTEGGEKTGAAPAPAARRRPAASLLAVAPSEMRSGLRAAYRLRPDARCVGAFSQMHAWLTGASVLPVSAAFVDGQWRLALGGAQVATLPELPDFDDCMHALRAAALGWTSAKPATPGQPRRTAPGMDSIAPRDLLDELRALDGNGSGGRMDARPMAPGARDPVSLTAQSLAPLGPQPACLRGERHASGPDALRDPRPSLQGERRLALDRAGEGARPLHGERRRRRRDRRHHRQGPRRPGRRPGRALRRHARRTLGPLPRARPRCRDLPRLLRGLLL